MLFRSRINRNSHFDVGTSRKFVISLISCSTIFFHALSHHKASAGSQLALTYCDIISRQLSRLLVDFFPLHDSHFSVFLSISRQIYRRDLILNAFNDSVTPADYFSRVIWRELSDFDEIFGKTWNFPKMLKFFRISCSAFKL